MDKAVSFLLFVVGFIILLIGGLVLTMSVNVTDKTQKKKVQDAGFGLAGIGAFMMALGLGINWWQSRN